MKEKLTKMEMYSKVRELERELHGDVLKNLVIMDLYDDYKSENQILNLYLRMYMDESIDEEEIIVEQFDRVKAILDLAR